MHINRGYTGGNSKGCRPIKAKIIYNTGLVTQKYEVEQSMKKYQPIRHELAMIKGIDMIGKGIIISFIYQSQILQQLHSNHMGIENETFRQGVSVLGEYEYRNSVHYRLLQQVSYYKRKAGSLAVDALVKVARIVFMEFGFPLKIFQMQA